MKNNTTIIFAAGIIVLVAGLFYLRGKNRSSTPANPAVDSHGHSAPANVSAVSLNSLVGKPASEFLLTDRDGNVYSPDALKGRNVVLFFNEGLMCYPACWSQIVSLAKDERFKDKDTVVLSVVADSKDDWQGAIDKMPELAQATVVFDRGAAVSNSFGALTTPSSMHYGRLPGHTYVVIDKNGVVRYVYDDPTMAINNDRLLVEIQRIK